MALIETGTVCFIHIILPETGVEPASFRTSRADKHKSYVSLKFSQEYFAKNQVALCLRSLSGAIVFLK